ncbi:MAG: hypothetical protein AAGF26_19455, partial [Cyanobacteria bacterium P01_G01_bin.49]
GYSPLLIQADSKLNHYSKKLKAKLNISKMAGEYDNNATIRRKALHSLNPIICDILMSKDSLTQEVLGTEKIEELVSQTNSSNYTDIVAVLLTVERWTSLARSVAHEARHKFNENSLKW